MVNSKFNSVLLIDDNIITNTLHETLLATSGFADNIIIFEAAVDALNYLKNDLKPENIPEIIMLDIRMPIMDGFGFLSEFETLSSNIKNKSKIIMLTSSLDENDRTRAKLNMHVIDFLVKPLTINLLNAIKV